MSTQVQSRIGTFVWRENVSPERDRAIEFYTQLFGWEVDDFDTGAEAGYKIINVGGQGHGGFPPVQPGTPPHWAGNVLVESLDDTVAKATAAGGTIIHGPQDMPEVGRFAVIADPQHAVVCAYEPAGEAPAGEGVFVWDELGTQDIAASESFYGAVFGWTAKDMGEEYGGYKIFELGETRVAGMMQLQDASAPGGWAPYVAVEDVDATVAKAQELGGSVLLEAMDVPNVGRIAYLKDAVGAVFGIIKPNAM